MPLMPSSIVKHYLFAALALAGASLIVSGVLFATVLRYTPISGPGMGGLEGPWVRVWDHLGNRLCVAQGAPEFPRSRITCTQEEFTSGFDKDKQATAQTAVDAGPNADASPATASAPGGYARYQSILNDPKGGRAAADAWKEQATKRLLAGGMSQAEIDIYFGDTTPLGDMKSVVPDSARIAGEAAADARRAAAAHGSTTAH